MAVKNYYLPQSLDEAVNLLAEHSPSLLVMAGGTLTMPLINEGVSAPDQVMGLRRAGLDTIRQTNGTLTIGAAATMSQVLETATPLLSNAAHHVGGWAIRNLATVGGNIFSPPPSGDFAVALLALEAKVKLVSLGGNRTLPLSEFYTGFKTYALAPDELLTEVEVSLPTGSTVFVKYGRKHANTPAIVSVAAHLELDGKQVKRARLALGAVGPHSLRATRAEAVLEDAVLDAETIKSAAEAASAECEPFDDAIASAWYRRQMTKVYVSRALTQLMV